MKRSNRLVLLVGVFLAVIAFVGIALLLSSPKTPDQGGPAAIPTVLPTVIAIQDIPLGVTVKPEMLKVEDRKIDGERKTTAFQSKELVVGQIVRRPITSGAQLAATDFDVSSTGCGVVDVPAGFVAIAVQVDQVSGVGTIINTADYVDMVVGFTGDKFPVVTLNPQDNSVTVVSGLNGTAVKVLLQGMQVLCRQLPPIAAPADGTPAASPGTGQPSTSLNGQQEIVILQVTAAQAEVIKFSQMDGSITLTLRSAKDCQDPTGLPIPCAVSATTGVTLKTLTTDFAVPIPELVEAVLPAQAKP